MNSHHVRTKYDWTVKRPSIAVVEAVAAATGRKPTDICSLHSTLDPDALDSLLRANRESAEDAHVTLSFSYAGQDVTVRSDGLVITHR